MMKVLLTKINKRSVMLGFLLCVFLLPSFLSTPDARQVAAQTQDLTGVRVAVYNGMPSFDSTIALRHMFAWMNAEVVLVEGEDIQGGILDTVDIFAVPGVGPGGVIANLEEEGIDALREFVYAGGGYFGICGGSLFPLYYSVHLFNGTLRSATQFTGTFIDEMILNRESTGPDLSDEPETYQTCIWGSSSFTAEGVPGYTVIANYSQIDLPGMILYRFGNGTVFLSSPHPEFEENSDRDGTSSFDYLDDPDSEWGFLQKIARYLVDAPPVYSDPSETTPPLVLGPEMFGIGIGVAAIAIATVLVALFLRKRKN
jgi:glutamine amidotransferase-like uncharacterized protein